MGARRQQTFPVLDAGQIETAKRLASGPARSFAPDEIVFDVGERQAPSWLVLQGSINTFRRDGLNHESAITTHVLPCETSGPGVFAIGDVRAGSTKRVAAAVGEGAAVVPQIHEVLTEG